MATITASALLARLGTAQAVVKAQSRDADAIRLARGRGTPWAIIGDALSIALLKMEQIPRFGRQIGHPRYMPCNTVTTVGHCSDSARGTR